MVRPRISCACRALLVACCAGGLAACISCPTVEFQPNVPEGGRAGSLAVHPTNNNVMLVASETGGLFRTRNGGAAWSHLGLVNPRTRDVAYAPNNPDVVIATTGGRFMIAETGIWRSTDGGATWAVPAGSRAPVGNRCGEVVSAHGVAFAPDTHRLFVGTDCGLAISDDLGVTWTHSMLDPARPANADKTQNLVLSVLAQAGGRLNAAGEDGVWFSQDGGVTWQRASTGPAWLRAGIIHGFAVSPYAPHHLLMAHRAGDQSALYLSTDGGANWTLVGSFTRDWARPPFVQTVQIPGPPGSPPRFRVYFGDGVEVRTATFAHDPAGPAFQNDWAIVPVNHADPSHFAIHSDGMTPLVLATDGGVHKLADGVWALTGAGSAGYNALQITEVTGQEVSGSAPHLDLYYGTQDNGVLGSSDGGSTWPYRRCCEGFFLRVPPQSENHQSSRVTGVKCGSCVNFITDQHLDNIAGWPNPPDGDSIADDVNGNPFLLPTPGHYVQLAVNDDASPLVYTFKLTTDEGASWRDAYDVAPRPALRPVIVGPSGDPVIYQAVERPGTTPDGFPKLGLKRISGIYGSSAATVADADVAGLGSLGIFPTMFAWYPVFGVDPWDPNHLIAADVETDEMKHSYDGGQSWHVSSGLTSLLTAGNIYRFRYRRFPMVTTIGFDPYARCHVLVGTAQMGIWRSRDGGSSWDWVAGSFPAANVSSFYFPREGPVYVSTYGRGLWKLNVDRDAGGRCLQIASVPHELGPPSIWDTAEHVARPFRWPPEIPGWCPECSYILVTHGQISDLQLSDGRVSQVTMAGGYVRQFDARGREVELEIPNAYDPDARSAAYTAVLAPLRTASKERPAIRGIVVAGRHLRGLVVSDPELPVKPGPVPGVAAFTRFAVGGMPIVEPGDGVTVHGTRFTPTARKATTVLSVGERVLVRDVPVEKDGHFRLRLRLDGDPGPHEIVVEQRHGRRLSRSTTTVLVVPGDEPKQ
jgi:photosystem II stability/assembly factor-like uncharacterized protein